MIKRMLARLGLVQQAPTLPADEQRLRDDIRNASGASAAFIAPIRDEAVQIYRRKLLLTAMRFSRSDSLLKDGKMLTADDVDAAYGKAPWRS